MAHTKVAVFDSANKFHADPDSATMSDLSRLLGNAGLGKLVFENRAGIEELFRQHDEVVRELT